MTDFHDPYEDRLRGLLAAADPVPLVVEDYAKAAFGWRNVDAELAELVYDSAADGELAGAVRSGGSPRALSFEAGAISIEVEVSREGEALALMGQLVPPQVADLEVRHGGGAAPVEADARGRFAVQGIQPGPVSLRCRVRDPEHSPAVDTQWLPL
jgi:hypothetical protein